MFAIINNIKAFSNEAWLLKQYQTMTICCDKLVLASRTVLIINVRHFTLYLCFPVIRNICHIKLSTVRKQLQNSCATSAWARNFQFGPLDPNWEFLSFGSEGFGGLLWRPSLAFELFGKFWLFFDLHVFFICNSIFRVNVRVA